MNTSSTIHITFIGRLEREKGVEILMESIRRCRESRIRIHWHICGNGSYLHYIQELEKYDISDITIYGQISHEKISEILSDADLVFMPSLFLETFGLVALESLMHGVPVSGFSRGGLVDFVHPDLVLDPIDPVGSLIQILMVGKFQLVDISRFSLDNWYERLRDIVSTHRRILIVHDYQANIGGAEQYIYFLMTALEDIGCQVAFCGYPKKPTRLMRYLHMIIAPWAFWRGKSIESKIQEFDPDLIWMHSILRYIGPSGIDAIARSQREVFISHHDLGCISERPGALYDPSDIPQGSTLSSWLDARPSFWNPFATFLKWYMISRIWYSLDQIQSLTHILPSSWMSPFFAPYTQSRQIIFPHTSDIGSNIKK